MQLISVIKKTLIIGQHFLQTKCHETFYVNYNQEEWDKNKQKGGKYFTKQLAMHFTLRVQKVIIDALEKN